MDKTKIKHIFFDLDNTLWDHRGNSEVTLHEMFYEYKIPELYDLDFDEWHRVYYNKNEKLWAQLRDGEIDKAYLREHRFRDSFEYFGIEDDVLNQKFEYNYLKNMTLQSGVVEGAVELLDFLKPQFPLHIITNGFIEVSAQKIETSALKGYFQSLTCADEVGERKPSPLIYEAALQKANATADESLLIGDDWIADVIGGRDFGMQTIFFNALNETHAPLEGVPVVDHLIQIKELF